MFTPEADGHQGQGVESAWLRLAQLVQAVSSRLGELEGALAECRARTAELEGQLERFLEGKETPSELLERLHRLEEENKDLKERIGQARAGVERMLARVRFLQENA